MIFTSRVQRTHLGEENVVRQCEELDFYTPSSSFLLRVASMEVVHDSSLQGVEECIGPRHFEAGLALWMTIVYVWHH